MKRLTDEWADKWGAAAAILQENRILALRRAGSGVVLECEHAHLLCLDGGVTLFRLEQGDNFVARVGKGIIVDCKRENLARVDCVVTCRGDDVTLQVTEGVTCFVNNELVRSERRLTPGDVVRLDRNHSFRFNNPAHASSLEENAVSTTQPSLHL